MWSCDLICNLTWLKVNKGELGAPNFTMKATSTLLQGPIDILFFADDKDLHHVRFILNTKDQALAQKCIDANIITWVNSIEAGVILQTKRSFEVPKIDGVSGLMTVLTAYDGGKHLAPYFELNQKLNPLDVKTLGASLAIWSPDLHPHLFYFRRMIDPAARLEFRWHNAYKLFEWHFAKRVSKKPGTKNELKNSNDWKIFVNGYQDDFILYLRTGQNPFNLVESIRAMVAHAYFDNRLREERDSQGSNLIRATYPTMNKMAVDLLNSLKDPSVPTELTYESSK